MYTDAGKEWLKAYAKTPQAMANRKKQDSSANIKNLISARKKTPKGKGSAKKWANSDEDSQGVRLSNERTRTRSTAVQRKAKLYRKTSQEDEDSNMEGNSKHLRRAETHICKMYKQHLEKMKE